MDLGAAYSIGSLTLDLPPASAWSTRTQTLSVQGGSDGSTFTTIAGSANHTFNPATGNTVAFPAKTARYVRLNFTADTARPAGQLSEVQVYAS